MTGLVICSSIIVAFVLYVLLIKFKSSNLKTINIGPKQPSGFKGLPFLGNVHQLSSSRLPKGIPQNAYLLQVLTGIAHVFSKEKIFKMSVGKDAYYFTFNTVHVQKLLTSREFINKPDMYEFFKPWIGLGLLTSQGDKWRGHRKFMNGAFNSKNLLAYQQIMSRQSAVMTRKLREDLKNCDILSLVQLCAMDIIYEAVLGRSVNTQKGENHILIESVHNLEKGFIDRAFNPLLWPNILFNISPTGRRFNKRIEYVHNFINEIIKTRKGEILNFENYEPTGIMDTLIMEHLRDPAFTEKDILDHINTLMFAGQDTTAGGLTWCLFNIGHHPEVQEKASEELFQVFGHDQEREITHEDLSRLIYLECIIKESLRMSPPVPFFARQIHEDFQIDENVVISSGSVMVVDIRSIGKQEDYFPKPHLFRPERFLFSEEESSERDAYAFVPFSAGLRSCIGQRFAILEMKTMLASILRNVQVTSLDPIDQIAEVVRTIVVPSRHLKFDLQPRVFKNYE